MTSTLGRTIHCRAGRAFDHNLRNIRLAQPVVEPVRLSSPRLPAPANLDQLLNGDRNRYKLPKLPPAVGRVFFVDDDGHPRWCTGVAVSSAHRNLDATAGQCADQQLDRWVFVPAYAHYRAPHGVFVGQQAFTHYDWTVYEDSDKNYAFVAVYDGVRLNGRHLRDTGRLAGGLLDPPGTGRRSTRRSRPPRRPSRARSSSASGRAVPSPTRWARPGSPSTTRQRGWAT